MVCFVRTKEGAGGRTERVPVPPVVQLKNRTALIIDPIIKVPVFDPAHRERTGTRDFRVRSVVLQAGNAYGGHYTTQVFGRRDGRGYGWIEYNDARIECYADTMHRCINSRMVEYVPYGELVYDRE